MIQIDPFNNYSYPIGLYAKKKKLKKQLHKKCKSEYTMKAIPLTLGIE